MMVEELDFYTEQMMDGNYETGEKRSKERQEFHRVVLELLPFSIQAWESRPLCCSSSGQGSFCPWQTLYWEPFLRHGHKNKRLPAYKTILCTGFLSSRECYNHVIEASVRPLLTRGVVGHVCSHWVRPWPRLVHHTVHAVHARAVWRACSHHALGHVRVARWPREENACLRGDAEKTKT